MKRWLTAVEAAAITGLSPRTMARYAERGLVRAEKAGKTWLFREADLKKVRTPPMGRPKK